jgi:hypothetical protein
MHVIGKTCLGSSGDTTKHQTLDLKGEESVTFYAKLLCLKESSSELRQYRLILRYRRGTNYLERIDCIDGSLMDGDTFSHAKPMP